MQSVHRRMNNTVETVSPVVALHMESDRFEWMEMIHLPYTMLPKLPKRWLLEKTILYWLKLWLTVLDITAQVMIAARTGRWTRWNSGMQLIILFQDLGNTCWPKIGGMTQKKKSGRKILKRRYILEGNWRNVWYCEAVNWFLLLIAIFRWWKHLLELKSYWSQTGG